MYILFNSDGRFIVEKSLFSEGEVWWIFFTTVKTEIYFREQFKKCKAIRRYKKTFFFLCLFRAFKRYYSSPILFFLPFSFPSLLSFFRYFSFSSSKLIFRYSALSLYVILSLWCFNFPLFTIHSSVVFQHSLLSTVSSPCFFTFCFVEGFP